MFDDLFCAEVIGSMRRSNQARNNKTFFYYSTLKVCENNANFDKEIEEMPREADQIHFMQQEHTARPCHLQTASQGFHPPDPLPAL